MANVAGFYGLQEYWAPVWAATIVAVADLNIALIIVLLGRNIPAGTGDRARIRCSQNGH
jgi:hypothetical protein